MDAKGVVFEGKTLDDAVKKGLSALGLPRAEVMITVEEEGSGGFLGLGSRPYRVRMMPRPRREMPDRGERSAGRGREGRRDTRERREPGRGDGRGREGRGRREYRGDGREGRERESRNGRGGRPAAETGARAASGMERAERGERMDRGERGDRGERRGRRSGRGREGDGPRGGPRRDAGGGPRPEPGGRRDEPSYGGVPRGDMEAGADAPRVVREMRREAAPPANPAELTAEVQRLSDDLFKAMGFEARVSAQIDETDGSTVAVRAEVPEDGELLTGEKGEVRQALQHLLNRMLNRGQVSRHHVQLEINDFWRQREGELQDLARRLADEALAEGTEKLTEYLNAQERRIVHVTLREDTRIKTYAIGDGLIKKVAIAPADHPEEQRQEE